MAIEQDQGEAGEAENELEEDVEAEDGELE